MVEPKKIVWLTATRADFGKLKKLISTVEQCDDFVSHVFATGMHMLPEHGSTVYEILKEKFSNIYLYNNVGSSSQMELNLANTIYGLSRYLQDIRPDLIVVHGDRPEPLAGAIVGSFNNVRVAHIEGGDLSGTIDGHIRHSISKLCRYHFVSNEVAKRRLINMGEICESIFVIGSPSIDLMDSDALPSLGEVKRRYEINFDEFSIFVYHPVTTEISELESNINEVVDALIASKRNYVLIHPNSDNGRNFIVDAYKRLSGNPRFNMFQSLRFEYYLKLLECCEFIVGNSSSGIYEAPIYGVPAVDIGTRQAGRYHGSSILHVADSGTEILSAIEKLKPLPRRFPIQYPFGDGNSAKRFLECIRSDTFWEQPIQKTFQDPK